MAILLVFVNERESGFWLCRYHMIARGTSFRMIDHNCRLDSFINYALLLMNLGL